MPDCDICCLQGLGVLLQQIGDYASPTIQFECAKMVHGPSD